MGAWHRMGPAVGLLAAVLLAGACGPTGDGTGPTGDATRGGSLWVESACVGCHGVNAEGSKLGPALADTPLTLREATSITRRGGPGMPKYPASQVSDEDLQAMYAWWQNPVPLPTAGAGQDPWMQSACTGCHGRDALGGSGPALAGTSQPLADFVAVVRQGAPGMPGYPEAQLSDESLQEMYDWLQAQAETATPAPTLGPERDVWATWACAGCHGRDALGGSGPGLADTPQAFAEFQSVVRQGAQGMPAFSEAQISDETLQAMYDWLQDEAPAPDAAGQPAQWMEASCGACHGVNGEGASATALAGEELTFEEFEQVVRGGEEGMPAYSTSQLSDTDLQEMYDWIMGLP